MSLPQAAPEAHTVHFYDDQQEVVGSVVAFALEGLSRGESVIVVCEQAHRESIDAAVSAWGADMSGAVGQGRYLSVDAEQTLDAFMIDGMPQPDAFRTVVGGLIELASRRGSAVRVFGEMVSVLWARGDVASAIELESLWNELAREVPFSLRCAYPADILNDAGLPELSRVCALHSAVVPPAGYGRYRTAHHDSSSKGGTAFPHATAYATDYPEDTYTAVFVPVPRAVGAVRQFVTGIVTAWGARDILGDAELASSEMATNAVLHARSAFRVTVSRSGDGVVVSVEDASTISALPHHARPSDLGGRGLDIVQAVAHRWGCDTLDRGKVVWAKFAWASATSDRGQILHAG